MNHAKQIKGKGNGEIGPKYISYVIKFLELKGMTVGDNEMKHLGYVNMENFKKELSKETKYFNKVYLPKDAKLIGTDGEEFASLELLNLIPLISTVGESLKINFELPSFIKLSFEYMKKKIKVSKNGSATSGERANSATSGNYAHSATSGERANSATSGYGAHSATSSSDGIACSVGRKAKAKASLGSWIVLAEWKEGKEFVDAKPIAIKSAQVDGKKIKADTWYKLEKGKFVITDDKND